MVEISPFTHNYIKYNIQQINTSIFSNSYTQKNIVKMPINSLISLPLILHVYLLWV